jgi:hypothetical protein
MRLYQISVLINAVHVCMLINRALTMQLIFTTIENSFDHLPSFLVNKSYYNSSHFQLQSHVSTSSVIFAM